MILEIENVTKRFGGLVAVNRVSLGVEASEAQSQPHIAWLVLPHTARSLGNTNHAVSGSLILAHGSPQA